MSGLPGALPVGLDDWEDGPVLPGGTDEQALLALVAVAAADRPDATAVLSDVPAARFTYRELETQVEAWADQLVASQMAGRPIGLCASGAWVAVGFLAIMRAGGVVVPLDPALPPDRLAALADGVGCPIVLGDAAGAPICSDLRQSLYRLDAAPPAPSRIGPLPKYNADAPACIYHTSGSTGRPKPVVLRHRVLASRLHSMAAWYSIGSDEVVCGATAIGFDPFLQALFFSLITGSTLWLPERESLLDPARFWPRAAELGITHLCAVPSQMEALMTVPPEAPLATLRRVVLGGERLTPDLVRRMRSALGATSIYNMYGPTEATVDATGHRVGDAAEGEELPIGRPLPGCRVRILDDALARVPAGMEGEICIGGAGLADGYLGMAEATAERFVADPYGAPGERLYRTGDIGCWRADGRIVFLGRRDEQVKVRGVRIELGEVEARLRDQPGVDQAVVSLWHEAPGGAALIAHVVGRAEPSALRRGLARVLPAAAVPLEIMTLARLPLMASGKVDRKALPLPRAAPIAMPSNTLPKPEKGDAACIRDSIAQVWARLLGHPIDPDANLFEAGAHSLLVPRALEAIAQAIGHRIASVDIFRFPSVAALARHLAGEHAEVDARPKAQSAGAGIAVVGMALRFPGADDRDAFWSNLLAGTESVRRFDRAALRQAGAPDALVDHPDLVPVHAGIDGVDLFDATAFGYGPGEAAEIDPQQRLLLQLALHALEDAACDPRRDGPVGTYVGVGFNAYMFDNLREHMGYAGGSDRYALVVAADKDFAATRLAYKLDLTGPALSINTACSTSLSATAAAVDALRLGRCRVALAGAVTLGMFSCFGYVHTKGGIASRAGRCRPFDAEADGTVGGTGGAVLVLKRLDDALADGDTIHGVVRGVGITNDGSSKAAYSAPSVDGQVTAIRAALEDAGVAPDTVGFVEGHGTATPLGDPIEVAALNIAYAGAEPRSILLGSVKGNIGHLDAAAGMPGLIKALLSLKHGTIPPTPHFTRPNPRIPFDEGPFRVNAAPEPWPEKPGVRRAGVSGFGMGGTNIHLIVEAPPQAPKPEATGGPQLVTLSAATPMSLQRAVNSLVDYLDRDDSPRLSHVAASLGQRRVRKYRRSAVGRTAAEIAKRLRADAPLTELAQSGLDVALMFPGQGAQHPGMARDLYRDLPVAHAVLGEAMAILTGTPQEAVPRLLTALPDDADAAVMLAQTEFTQPALFIAEYTVAKALEQFGIRPTALVGHSVGEYVAACLSGVMSFADTLRLVATRGRVMAQAVKGAMLAVALPEAQLAPMLAETGADLAAVNTPQQCVASGTEAQIAALESRIAALGKTARRLSVSHAFHSALMDPILESFAREVSRTPLAPPSIPIVSNVTGKWLTAEQAVDPDYWARQLRGTVRFAEGLTRLAEAPRRLLIEAGPGLALSRMARAGGIVASRVFATQPDGTAALTVDGHASLLEAVGCLWCAGVEIARPTATRRVPLPLYPFEAQRHWIEPGVTVVAVEGPVQVAAPNSAGDMETAIADVWRDVLGVATIGPDDDFLALGGDSLIAVRLAARLRHKLVCDVSAEAVLRGGTIAKLAALLKQAAPEPALAREEGVL